VRPGVEGGDDPSTTPEFADPIKTKKEPKAHFKNISEKIEIHSKKTETSKSRREGKGTGRK